MDAINKLDNPKIKLTVFGSVVPELKEKFNSLLSDNVIYSGWKKSDDIYDEFAAADIVVFLDFIRFFGSRLSLWASRVYLKESAASLILI